MKSWNGSGNGVVAAPARSTCSSPSASGRTVMPRRTRAVSSMGGSSMAILQFLVRVERRGNEGIGGAEVAGRLERGIDLLGGDAGRREPFFQLGHWQQHVAQRPPGADGPRA